MAKSSRSETLMYLRTEEKEEPLTGCCFPRRASPPEGRPSSHTAADVGQHDGNTIMGEAAQPSPSRSPRKRKVTGNKSPMKKANTESSWPRRNRQSDPVIPMQETEGMGVEGEQQELTENEIPKKNFNLSELRKAGTYSCFLFPVIAMPPMYNVHRILIITRRVERDCSST